MAGKKRKHTAGTKAGAAAPSYSTPTPRTPSRVAEPVTLIRRKNFDLDQHRIDRVRVALGARTEREAITRAMDIALDVVAFSHDVAAGSHALFGRGGFTNEFDEPEALEFSGFTDAPATQDRP